MDARLCFQALKIKVQAIQVIFFRIRDQAVDQLLEIAVHDGIDLIECQLDPVVCHTSLREVVGTDLLGAVTGTDLAAALCCLRVLLLLQLQIIQLGTQEAECLFFVLQLGFLGLL